MPGPSGASPAVWGDSVFVTSANEETEELTGHCFDRASGKVKWTKVLGKGFRSDNRSNYASPSPATDGNVVLFFFGTGELSALSMDGEILWQKNLQKDYGSFYFLWTFSTSPLLVDGNVVMQVLQRDEPVHKHQKGGAKQDSYLVAFDAKTGKEVWKVARPSDAVSESREAFSTPIVHEHEGRREILVAGGDCLTGHDPKTGKEIWRWGTWNKERIPHWRHVTTPVAGGGVVLACAPKKSPIYAVKLGLNGTVGDKEALRWVSEDRAVSTDVSTPVFYDGYFYVLHSDVRTISCVSPDGMVIWTEELDTRAKFEASPVAGDGKIYLTNFHGEVFVIKAGTKYELLHRTKLGEGKDQLNRATPAISQGNIFIRNEDRLWCLGK